MQHGSERCKSFWFWGLGFEAQHQLPALYPRKVADVIIPARAPNGRCTFDRQVIHRYVRSRSSTSSPGISGFGFSWIQLFANLTAAHEDDEHPDPNWTICTLPSLKTLRVAACLWLRHWATDLKGCLFNNSMRSIWRTWNLTTSCASTNSVSWSTTKL